MLDFHPTDKGFPVRLPDRDIDPARLEDIVDSVLAQHLEDGPVPGAVVAIVRGEEVLLLKGYGYADARTQTPMDASQSLIRIGSVSKLFTWTAIMQLFELGLVNLDCDVNTYLDRPFVPKAFGIPVTLRNLLTQTPGFEDNCFAHMIDRSADDLEPLAEALERHVPKQVFPPTTDFSDGRFASYSNWGGALAGHIVAHIAGKAFEDYVESQIFQPLGMADTTFREPLPEDWLGRMASGHEVRGTKLLPQPFEFHGTFGPAGSVTTTAADMARFMSAHLLGGVFKGHRILNPATTDFMHRRALSPHPNVNGFALGFYEEYMNGRRTIGHAGDTLFFSSQMTLLPEHKLGIFVAYNSRPPSKFRGAVAKAIVDAFFPAELPAIASKPGLAKDLKRYTGAYRSNRRSYSTFEKATTLLDPKSTVKITADQTGLNIKNLAGVEDQHWTAAGQGVFRQTTGDKVIAFVDSVDGKVANLLATIPFDPLRRIRWTQTAEFHRVVLLACLLTSVAFLTLFEGQAGTGFTTWAWWLANGVAIANLTIVVLLVGIFTVGGESLLYAVTRPLRVAVTLPYCIAPLAGMVGILGVWAWIAGYWDAPARALYTLHALTSVVVLWELHHWNLMGARHP